MGEANRRKAARGQVRDFFVPKHQCPNCKAILDGMTAITPGKSPHTIPKTHTILGICIKCHHLFVYDSGDTRELNDREIVEIAGDKELLRGMKALGAAKEIYERMKKMKESNNGKV